MFPCFRRWQRFPLESPTLVCLCEDVDAPTELPLLALRGTVVQDKLPVDRGLDLTLLAREELDELHATTAELQGRLESTVSQMEYNLMSKEKEAREKVDCFHVAFGQNGDSRIVSRGGYQGPSVCA